MSTFDLFHHDPADTVAGQPTLLIIEDDQVLNLLIGKLLRRQGFQVASASTGAEGIQLMHTLPDPLLLLDYTLPDMTGKDVILALAGEPCLAPFIVMTGQGDERVAVEMMKLGARDYLIKGHDFLDLLPTVVQQTVEQLMTERGLQKARLRIHHLNAVLNGIRHVQRLITQESDRDRLIQGACDNLVGTFGYHSAWIGRLDEQERFTGTAQAGFGERFVLLEGQIKAGELPGCIAGALQQDKILAFCDSMLCNGCPIGACCSDYAILSTRMAYAERIYGVLVVGAPSGFVDDREAHTLFAEIARDLAFALYKIDLEEERRRSEAELRLSQARLVAAMQAGNLAWWMKDLATGQMLSDERRARMLGYPPGDLSIAHYSALGHLFHPDDRERVLQAMRAHLEGRAEAYDAEYRLQTSSGTWRWFHDYGRITERDPEGRPLYVTGVMADVTARKEAEEQLRRTLDELEQRVAERTSALSLANADLSRALRVKDEFLANMSHELRTPLNAILGFVEILREQIYGSLNERQDGALATIEQSSHHLLDLINDVLDLAKIGAGHSHLEPGRVDVAETCHSSLLLVRQSALKKKLQILLELDPVITTLHADGRRLKQILVNLLSNAVKFTPEGGQVGMEVRGDMAQGQVHFTVWDTGIGIAPEHLEHVFQPFVQVDSSLSRQHEGAGLGLNLVRRLAELHGGEVQVSSVAGQGSRFTVSLPWQPAGPVPGVLQQVAGEAMPANGSAAPVVNEGPLVLLAEDNQSSLEMLAEYLELSGYRIITARDGEEALHATISHHPAVILMDIQMPGVDGLEAIRRIRAEAPFATTPIVALTALAMPGDRERCLAAGATDYLSKPVSLSQLRRMIEQLI